MILLCYSLYPLRQRRKETLSSQCFRLAPQLDFSFCRLSKSDCSHWSGQTSEERIILDPPEDTIRASAHADADRDTTPRTQKDLIFFYKWAEAVTFRLFIPIICVRAKHISGKAEVVRAAGREKQKTPFRVASRAQNWYWWKPSQPAGLYVIYLRLQAFMIGLIGQFNIAALWLCVAAEAQLFCCDFRSRNQADLLWKAPICSSRNPAGKIGARRGEIHNASEATAVFAESDGRAPD